MTSSLFKTNVIIASFAYKDYSDSTANARDYYCLALSHWYVFDYFDGNTTHDLSFKVDLIWPLQMNC